MTPKAKQLKVVNLDRQMCVLRFSLDGKMLLAGGQDASIRRFDGSSPDLKALPPLTGHNGWVTSLALLPDGKRLVSGDTWGGLLAWHHAEAQPKPLWNVGQAHDGWIRGVAVSPDGQTIATAGADAAVRLWSAGDGMKIREWKGPNEFFSLLIAPDGKSLVTGDCKANVQQWDVATGKPLRSFDAKSMYSVHALQEVGGARWIGLDPKGTTLMVAGALGGPKGPAGSCILLFDWTSGKLTHTVKAGAPTDGYVWDVAWHPTGFLMGVLSGQPGQGRLFFIKPGEAQAFFTQVLTNPIGLAVTPDCKKLITISTNAGSNGNGRVLGKDKEYPGNYSPLTVFEL